MAGKGEGHQGVLRHGPVLARADPEARQASGAVRCLDLLDPFALRGVVLVLRGRLVQTTGRRPQRVPDRRQCDVRGFSGLRDGGVQMEREALREGFLMSLLLVFVS